MEGTGNESATQPLGTLAALTATREVLPVGEAGLGVKFQVSEHIRLRVQVRDYFSKAPDEVIAPAPGASLSGLRQDIIGTVSFSVYLVASDSVAGTASAQLLTHLSSGIGSSPSIVQIRRSWK